MKDRLVVVVMGSPQDVVFVVRKSFAIAKQGALEARRLSLGKDERRRWHCLESI
jgi:hypothetical protein